MSPYPCPLQLAEVWAENASLSFSSSSFPSSSLSSSRGPGEDPAATTAASAAPRGGTATRPGAAILSLDRTARVGPGAEWPREDVRAGDPASPRRVLSTEVARAEVVAAHRRGGARGAPTPRVGNPRE